MKKLSSKIAFVSLIYTFIILFYVFTTDTPVIEHQVKEEVLVNHKVQNDSVELYLRLKESILKDVREENKRRIKEWGVEDWVYEPDEEDNKGDNE